MKVAYILPSLQKPSGWRTLTLGLLNHIDQAEIEELIFVPPESWEQANDAFPGKQIYTLPTTQQYSLATLEGVRRLLACKRIISESSFPKIDLVHSLEAYPTGLVGSWLARKVGCPHVFTAHGTYSVIWAKPSGWLGRLDLRAYHWVLGQTRMIYAVSTGTARQIRLYFEKWLDKTTISVITPGNDFYKYVSRQQAIQRPIPEIPTLLTVGDLKPRKGQHISLAAFVQVKRQLPAARYWLVGSYNPDQPYYQKLQRDFLSLKQPVDDISFLGAVSDEELQRLYQEASLFVLTPQHDDLNFEGFGLVYLEAGAYGLPVVATRAGGVPDAIENGKTGLLAEPGDVNAIVAAILQLLNDPEAARRMGRANRDWAERQTWERFAQAHLRAYNEIFFGENVVDNYSSMESQRT